VLLVIRVNLACLVIRGFREILVLLVPRETLAYRGSLAFRVTRVLLVRTRCGTSLVLTMAARRTLLAM
jgi:hypothetical protein